jgi:hypothetical protein
MKQYDVIVWIDGNIHVHNATSAEWLLKNTPKHQIISWVLPQRKGDLQLEARLSMELPKYYAEEYRGQRQPSQQVTKQVEEYMRQGYDVNFFKTHGHENGNNNPDLGIYVTCIVAVDNRNKNVTKFLDRWWLHNLNYTTQDQISFPYVAQLEHLVPLGLPLEKWQGYDLENFLFRKNDWHGERKRSLLV